MLPFRDIMREADADQHEQGIIHADEVNNNTIAIQLFQFNRLYPMTRMS